MNGLAAEVLRCFVLLNRAVQLGMRLGQPVRRGSQNAGQNPTSPRLTSSEAETRNAVFRPGEGSVAAAIFHSAVREGKREEKNLSSRCIAALWFETS